MFIVFLNPSLKSPLGHFQGRKAELDGPWEVIITLGVVRVVLSIINAGEVLRDGCTEGVLLSSSSSCFSSHLSSAAPWLFLWLWFHQPFSRGQSWLAFVGLISHLALLRCSSLPGGIYFPSDTRAGSAPSWSKSSPHLQRKDFLSVCPLMLLILSQIQGRNSGNNFVWKEWTRIRDPTDLSGGKALMRFEFPANLKALVPLKPLEYLQIYFTPHQGSLSKYKLGSELKILPSCKPKTKLPFP